MKVILKQEIADSILKDMHLRKKLEMAVACSERSMYRYISDNDEFSPLLNINVLNVLMEYFGNSLENILTEIN